MAVDYVPVADLTTRAEMIARQKEIRRRQEEAAGRLAAQRAALLPPALEAPAPMAEPISIPNEVLARMPNAIIRKVAAEHGVTFAEIIGDGRLVHIVTARQAAIRAVKEAHPIYSYKRLGRIFGGRDHSSILQALGLRRKGEKRIKQRTGKLTAEAPTPTAIIEVAARKYGVLPRDVIGRSYKDAVTLARAEAVANIRAAHPDLTSRQIGEIFDGRSENFERHCLSQMRKAA